MSMSCILFGRYNDAVQAAFCGWQNEYQRTVVAVWPELGLQNTILSKAGGKFLEQGSFSMSHGSI